MKLCLKENIIKRLKNKKLNEAFKSKKLDALNRQHGGLDWGAYNASELTDDEIGDTFERGGRHFNSNHDITFKDGSGVHINPTKAHRNINNGFRMTPDKEGYDRHMELTRRNHWSGRELPSDEYWSRNPHYNRLKMGFGNVENGKHKLHHSWKDNFRPGERDSQGNFMNMSGNGDGPGSYGGEEQLGTGMNHRLSTVDHAKDWYNMKNMDRQQKRDYLERKYKGKLHPALYHDFENENTKKDKQNTLRLTENQLHNIIKESVKKVLKEGDWDTPKRQKALKQVAGRAFADSDRLTKMGRHDEAQKRFQVGVDAHQRLNGFPSKSDMQNNKDFKEGMKKSWSTGRFAKGGKFGKK